jgi:hypothetical protein
VAQAFLSLPLANDGLRVHTPIMTLKNAAFLALIGMSLLSLLLAMDLVNLVLGFARDVVPLMTVLRSMVHLLAILSLVVFFYVFYTKQ